MGKVYINAEGKFLHFSEVATHTGTGYVYSWVDLNQATVVKDAFALSGIRWREGRPEVVAQLPASEVRTVTLDPTPEPTPPANINYREGDV